MSISKKDIKDQILYTSLVGKEIEILDSKNKNQIGLKGIIVYETAKFFHVSQNGSIKRIYKPNIQFKVFLKGKPLKVEGCLLFSSVVYRIKKMR